MLEEALRVFSFDEVVTTNILDKRYNELIRKNYEDNFPYNKEVGSMNIRLLEWSYQIILPFSMAKTLEVDNVNLDDLKILCLLKELNIDYDMAMKNYHFDQILGYQKNFFEWIINELVKREMVPVSSISRDILEKYYASYGKKLSLKKGK